MAAVISIASYELRIPVKENDQEFKSIGVFEQCCMTSIEDFEGSPSKQRDPGSEIAEPGITPAHLRIEGDNQ